MGLKSTIASAVASGMSALGDLKVSITYVETPISPTYDPTAGSKTTATPTTYTLQAIFYKARDREVDGIKVLVDDVRVVFEQTNLAITPSQNDTVTVLGKSYNIVNVIQDPAQATWILYLRGT